jgi:phosphatidate cytidylyltransferase
MSDDHMPVGDETVTTDSSPVEHGRAGRNLVAAIGAGLVLVALVLVSLFTVKWLFAVVAAVALMIAVNEFHSAMANRGIRLNTNALYVGVAAVTLCSYLGGAVWLVGSMGLLVVALIFLRLRQGTDGYVRDTSASIFVAAYLPLMIGFAMLMLRADNGPARIVAFIALTVASDIGGYVAGVLFGRHPIAPAISPKKSWEGLIGSLLLESVVGALLFYYVFDAPWWQGVIVGIVMTIVATLGDFAESAIKRDLGVKDMGTIVPGHGGMMDRLDSLLPNAFVAWLLFSIFLGS